MRLLSKPIKNFRSSISHASFGEKKIEIGRAIFTLINKNGHYCTMLENLFWPPFLNRTIFFFKFYFKNVNLYMFFNFELNSIERFLWESGFSKFSHMAFFAKRKLVFWPPCWNETFFHKTFRVYHVYCNFILGYMCRTTVIFGTLKDESLLINMFASNNYFSNMNIFQNGTDTLSKNRWRLFDTKLQILSSSDYSIMFKFY